MLSMPTSTSAVNAAKTVRAPTALGVSMLLLLLSAIHSPATGDGLMDPSGPYTTGGYHHRSGGAWQYTQTPYLAYVASIASGDDIDVGSVLSLGSGPSTTEADERPRRRNGSAAKRAAAAAAAATATADGAAADNSDDDHLDSSSTASVTASHETTTEEHDLSSDPSTSGRSTPQPISVLPDTNNVSTAAAVPAAARAVSIAEMPAELVANALSFLNARDLGACRGASAVLHGIAETACAVMHHNTEVVDGTFIVVDPNAPCRAAEVAQCIGSSWCCARCNAHNTHMAESCRGCRAPNGTTRRVFFGQLRKEQTAEVLHYLIAYLRPEVRVVHIESHTNPTDGRGKGCAWVYVASDADAAQLLTLNKALFFDYDETMHREGVWLAGPATADNLAGFAAKRAYTPMRPAVMPRQPVVVELPKGARPLQIADAAPIASAAAPTAAFAPAAQRSQPPRNRRRPATHFAAHSAPSFFNYHNGAYGTVTVANTPEIVAAAPQYNSTSPSRRITADHYRADATLAHSLLPVDDAAPATCQCEACVAAAYNSYNGYGTYGGYGGYAYNYANATACNCEQCAGAAYTYHQ